MVTSPAERMAVVIIELQPSSFRVPLHVHNKVAESQTLCATSIHKQYMQDV